MMNGQRAVAPRRISPWPAHEDLRYRRTSSGLSLETLAAQSRIQRRYLEAIEQGRIDDLPAGPYRRSFIHSYLDALGIVDEGQRESITSELMQESMTAQLHPGPPPSRRAASAGEAKTPPRLRDSIPVREVAVAAFFLICGIAFVRMFVTGAPSPSVPAVFAAADAHEVQAKRMKARQASIAAAGTRAEAVSTSQPGASGQSSAGAGLVADTSVTTNQLSPADSTQPGPTGSTSFSGAAAGAAVSAQADTAGLGPRSRAVLRATSKVWMRVSSPSKGTREMTLQPGETLELDLSETHSVRVGNAAGLAVTVGNRALAPLGAEGQVRTLTIDADGAH